jgi:nickel-dependent lactate racemase
MEIMVPYGHDSKTVDCPEENLAGICFPNEVPQRDEHKILQEAITNPIGAGPLGNFLANNAEVLFMVNDATRPTPTALILNHLAGEIKGSRPVHFLVATGAHAPPHLQSLRRSSAAGLSDFRR